MSDPFVFGYGSLVNRLTHDFHDAHPARLRGWRREWRYLPQFGRTFLTAVRDEGAVIDGLVARVPGADWTALDMREAGYGRHVIEGPALDHALPTGTAAHVYAMAQDASHLPETDQPIRLSYLDVVVAGFHAEFGETGVMRFFETTTGWASIVDDRAAPMYPRARPVTAEIRQMADDWLSAARVVRLPG